MTDTVDLSFLSDGTYGRELGRISPEGNMYGQIRVVRDVVSSWWWNGTKWLMITDDIGQSETFDLLPTTGQKDEIWRCKGTLEGTKQWWRYFRWDVQSQSWQELELFWTVEAKSDLPSAPYKIGQCHQVKEPEVLAVWDGYSWRRLKVGSFEDDIGLLSSLETLEAGSDSIRSDFNELLSDFGEFQQETEQIYNGFIRGFTPELELIYVSENELSIRPRYNDYDYLVVNEQNIKASKRTSVFTTTPVLNWNSETESLYYSTLQPSTTYWIYWANRSEGFNISVYDYRGKLFCSTTEPSSNYLGESGLGLDAILIGQAQTNSSTKFLYTLDVSLVSRQSDLNETFREFSDFDLIYIDESTLQLKRNYGAYGQIYIPESLYYIGENREVYTSSSRIIYNEDDGTIEYDDTAISPGQIYYVYIGSNSDIYNFNDINSGTGLPWHPEDVGAELNYDADKDFRLWLFLSVTPPTEGRLSSTYFGYWARHLGQVRTDGLGNFIYSSGISAIRQPTLNPTYLDGLAEISIQKPDDNTIAVCRRTATSGIVMVGGRSVQTYSISDLNCHKIALSDPVYEYEFNGSTYELGVTTETPYNYINSILHIYLLNDISIWGSLSNTIILSNRSPVIGQLDENFPGNNARWICSVRISGGSIGGSVLENGDFATSDDWSNLDIPVEHIDYIGEDGDDNTSVTPATVAATGNSTSPNTFSASTSYSGYDPWHAFNQTAVDIHDAWLSSATPTTNAPQSLMVDFGSGNEKVINKYCFTDRPINYYPDRVAPRDWKLQASNDVTVAAGSDASWTDLDTRSGIDSPGTNGEFTQYFTFINHTPYRYYRIRVTDRNGTNPYVGIGELRLVAATITEDHWWTGTDDWSWYESTPKVSHNTGSVLPLDQSLTVTTGSCYKVTITLTETTAGYIIVTLGSVASSSIASNGTHRLYVYPTSSSGFSITPTSDFDGSILSVTCEEVYSPTLMGNFLIESVVNSPLTIDDNSASINTVFSSSKVLELLNNFMAQVQASSLYRAITANGLGLYINNAGTTRLRLLPQSESTTIAFPDDSTRIITASGVTSSTIDGTLDYSFVWLSPTTINVNTSAPTSTDGKLFLRENLILAGYLYRSTENTGIDYGISQATGASSPSPYSFYGNRIYGAYEPWKAFSHTYASEADAWISSISPYHVDWWAPTTYLYPTITVDCGEYNSQIFNRYAMRGRPGSSFPTSWYIEASQDGNSWFYLDIQQDQPYVSGSNWSEYYTFHNTTPYRYYRLRVFGMYYTGAYLALSELKFVSIYNDETFNRYRDYLYPITMFAHGSDGANNPSLIPIQSYAAVYETSHYDISVASNLFSYRYDDSYDRWISDPNTPPTDIDPECVMVDTGDGSAVVVNKYLLQSIVSGSLYPSAWQIQGSNDTRASVSNDSYWDTLDTQTGQTYPNTIGGWASFTFENSTAYRFYRLRVNGPSSSGYVGLANLMLIPDTLTA